MNDLDSALATIAKHADELRRKRVQSVTVGEVSFSLLPEVTEEEPIKTADDTPPDPLSDPKTYGWEGSSVPGFKDPRKAS